MIEKFKKTIKALRHPETGCPWDLKQTHLTLRPYLIEECYELIDAIESGNDEELKGELGDVLLQVVLHSQLASERGAFNFDDVVKYVDDKIVRRHPHVFEDTSVKDEEEVKVNWEKIKQKEKKSGLLDGIPKALPALAKALRIGQKASHVGFDWEEVSGVRKKLDEEISELDEVLESENKSEIEHELGDVLFTVAQLARKLGLSPEEALNQTNKRFYDRFSKLEPILGKSVTESSPEELEEAWEKAKGLL